METIERVRQLIQQTYKSRMSVVELCQRADVSYETLRRPFRKLTGMTLQQYYAHLRVREAKRLLAETDLRVFEIAYELEFRHESNFSTWFYRKTGMWPTDYRKETNRRGSASNRGGVNICSRTNLHIQLEYPKVISFCAWSLFVILV